MTMTPPASPLFEPSPGPLEFETMRDVACSRSVTSPNSRAPVDALNESAKPVGVLVMDDYAHHPTEVRANIAAAIRAFPERRVIWIYQPHTYSRISYLWDEWLTCWNGLDALIVLETYAAREVPQGWSLRRRPR